MCVYVMLLNVTFRFHITNSLIRSNINQQVTKIKRIKHINNIRAKNKPNKKNRD